MAYICLSTKLCISNREYEETLRYRAPRVKQHSWLSYKKANIFQRHEYEKISKADESCISNLATTQKRHCIGHKEGRA